MNITIMEFQQVCFDYFKQENYLINNLNFKVKKGEFVSILGPNGAGKSTILKLASNIQKPLKGCVKLKEKNIREYSKNEFALKAAYLPQEINEWYDINVFEYVLHGRYPYLKGFRFASDKDVNICKDVMDKCGVLKFQDRTIFELSGGEKQRVRLASVLSQEPELLILDEPTSSLDIHNELDFFSLLSNLSKSGTAILLATHNLNFASLYSEKLILMDKGKILAEGIPKQVMTQENINGVYGNGFEIISHKISGNPILYPK